MRAFATSAWLVVGLVTVLYACSKPARRPALVRPQPPPDAGAPPPPPPEEVRLEIPEDDAAPAGGVHCENSTQCGAGEQCRGAPGCRSPWACGAARECLPEVIAYCGCDGATFYAAGGCPGRPYAHLGPCDELGEPIVAHTELGMPAWDEPIVSDRRRCSSSADCSRGRICWGIPGCATDWSCVRARGCTRDSVAYCGCDGQTFYASSTCPGRPYLHRGACQEAVALADSESRSVDGTGPRETARPRTPEPSRPDADRVPATSTAPPPPRACRTSGDCPRGQVCQGPPGCGGDEPWQCGPPERECVRDTQVFCGCDGRDFRASMFCPGRPYRHRGSCAIDRLIELSGAVVR